MQPAIPIARLKALRADYAFPYEPEPFTEEGPYSYRAGGVIHRHGSPCASPRGGTYTDLSELSDARPCQACFSGPPLPPEVAAFARPAETALAHLEALAATGHLTLTGIETRDIAKMTVVAAVPSTLVSAKVGRALKRAGDITVHDEQQGEWAAHLVRLLNEAHAAVGRDALRLERLNCAAFLAAWTEADADDPVVSALYRPASASMSSTNCWSIQSVFETLRGAPAAAVNDVSARFHVASNTYVLPPGMNLAGALDDAVQRAVTAAVDDLERQAAAYLEEFQALACQVSASRTSLLLVKIDRALLQDFFPAEVSNHKVVNYWDSEGTFESVFICPPELAGLTTVPAVGVIGPVITEDLDGFMSCIAAMDGTPHARYAAAAAAFS